MFLSIQQLGEVAVLIPILKMSKLRPRDLAFLGMDEKFHPMTVRFSRWKERA